MRKLMSFAAVVLLASSTSLWAAVGLGDIKFDGSLEVSGKSSNNETDYDKSLNDHIGNTGTRVRLGMDAAITEGVTGRLEAVRSPRLYGTAATTVQTEQPMWSFQNAFVDFENLWTLQARLGRQYTGKSNDLLWHFGPKYDDNLTVTAIDGLLLAKKWDKVDAEVFTGKAQDTAANISGTVNNNDINLNNIEVNLKLLPNNNIRLAYMLGKSVVNQAATNDDITLVIYRLGTNGSLLENMITYQAEFMANDGKNKGSGTKLDYSGSALDLGAGFNSPDLCIGKVSANIGYLMTSGDKNNTDSKDKSFHDFSLLTGGNVSDRYYGEIFGRSNVLNGPSPVGSIGSGTNGQGLEILSLGAKFIPKFDPKASLAVDYYNFTAAEKGAQAASTFDKYGNEIDFTLGYAQSDNVMLTGGFAMLSPDDLLTGGGAAKDDSVNKLFARATVKWGGEEK